MSAAARIFISYRRAGSAAYAQGLYDRLRERYGREQIFRDLDMEYGIDFVERVDETVRSCAVMLVIIGPGWLDARDEAGNRRIDDPDDYVRIEVSRALNGAARVIPVLVGDARMPRKAELPDALSRLARRNALQISDGRWHYDVSTLIGTLDSVLQERDDATRLAPGSSFAGYRIESVLDRGGMGVVYRATDPDLDRSVALKIIAPEHTRDPTAVARFKAEARLAASLEHPNIVPVHRGGDCEGVIYLAMRLVPGDNLRHVIDSGPLDLHLVGRVVARVADALDAAHELGLVHRDVKPTNILLSGVAGQEHVYLTDIGLTKRLGSSSGRTGTGSWVGTPDYVAPEQIRGHAVDGRADVYSLGCVLYEMLARRVPYPRGSHMGKLWAHVSDPPPLPRRERPDLVEAFDKVVARATAKEPADRYSTAGELAAALEDAISQQEAELGRQAEQQAAPAQPTAPTAGSEPSPDAAAPGRAMALPRQAAHGFRDIQFGFADAHKEGAEAPNLLLDGFFDDGRLIEHALSGPSFLFLGYKGSGKTAIAERARLLGERDPQLFVTAAALDDLSYGDFNTLAGAQADVESRYPTAWAWVLLLLLVQSLQRDEAARVQAPGSYADLIEGLRSLNLLPLPQLNQLVTSSSKRGFKATMPKFFEYTEERAAESPDLQMMQMVRALREAVLLVPTASRHVVFIDGLDEVLAQSELQFNALAALISEASRLNDALRAAGKPFKFVVLCRTDIFDRLPGANKNKIRRDSAESLEWFDDPRDPDRTRLVQLVNLRAHTSLGRPVNLFGEYFPARIDGRPIRRFLLQHTRHLPRDVLQLMKSLQRFAPSAASEALTEDQLRSGIRHYSNEYFLPELRDELHGYLGTAEIDTAIKLLASLRTARFTLHDLESQAMRLRLGSVELEALVHTLFECSGIGMVDSSGGGRPVVTFKYRNRTAMLMPDARMLVHPGAWNALNIQPARPRSAGSKTPRGSAPGRQ